MAQVSQVSDAEGSKVEDEGRAFKRGVNGALVNRNIVDKDVPHSHVDAIPFRPIVSQAAQDDRIPMNQLYIVVVGVFPSYCDHMGSDVRGRVHAGRQGVGDDLGPLARRDLKKVMAKVLDEGVGLARISETPDSFHDIEIAAGGFSSRAEEDRQEKRSDKRYPELVHGSFCRTIPLVLSSEALKKSAT